MHLVVICDGAKGSHSPHLESSVVRETRREELQSAADVLGAASVTSLDWPDGEVDNSLELREALVGLVRRLTARGRARTRPDGDVLRRGLREPPRPPRDGLGPARRGRAGRGDAALLPRAGASRTRSSVLLLSGTHEPDVVVDVSRTIDTKVKAVLAHASQLAGDAEAIRDVVLERAEQAGRPMGVAYGEAFRCVELAF